ncbi:hypothetical protein EpJS10_0100 [Escherichia phage JS10]|uniref:Phage protein n=3 Tax=Dhakavirus TaxID=1914165 RepID=C4MZJ5_9CAUD|nr:hypothetical protein EpJS10_0100 [Escherichia phage JS10]ACL78326.1 hypothetical protein EpJS10_0100 [Escherichia phage JS10]
MVMSQARILKTAKCEKCEWPVIAALCNDEMECEFDYWWYCSNKGCSNHKGEGFHSGYCEHPKFVRYGEPK